MQQPSLHTEVSDSGNVVLVGAAWPYANGPLHAGHLAGAYLPADIFARYKRAAGSDVLFVSGSDCHGTPITLRAEKEGVSPRDTAERYHKQFLDYWERLGISFDLFTTTMTANHEKVVQEEFLLLLRKNYLFEQDVTAFYDTELQRFLPDRYILGVCPHCEYPDARGDQCDNCGRPLDPDKLIRPRSLLTGKELSTQQTRHFYLDLPGLQGHLEKWITSKTHWRKHVFGETQKFLSEGLHARAITRDIDWGIPIPVPGFDDRRIYVWFEAVTGYLSASIEWASAPGRSAESWQRWWANPSARQYYFLGKDNIPFHTIIWPAILMARGDLQQLPYDVPANNFLTFGGKKASKSDGTGSTLDSLLESYQADAIRFYISAIMPETDDSVFSDEDFHDRINRELVGTWGNLVSRTLHLIETKCGGRIPAGEVSSSILERVSEAFRQTGSAIEQVEIRRGLREAMNLAQFANGFLSQKQPWRKDIQADELASVMLDAVYMVDSLRIILSPYLPFSSRQVAIRLGYDDAEADCVHWAPIRPSAGRAITVGDPLFRKL